MAAGRLRLERGPALADRLVDHRQVLLQHGGNLRIELAGVGVGDGLQIVDRLLIVRFGRLELRGDRFDGDLRRRGVAARSSSMFALRARSTAPRQ